MGSGRRGRSARLSGSATRQIDTHRWAPASDAATVLQVQSLARTLLGRPIRFAPASNGYSALRGSLTQPLAIVGCAILLVLAITCVNLASLMLADSASRARELAVRKAMGASRARIVRQLLFESLAPSLFGSILALLVGYELNAALLKFLPPDQSPALANLHFTVDVRLLAFTLLLAVLTCACFAAVPALIGTAGNETEEFRAGASTEDSRTRAYLRRALLVGEIAISTMIMVAGGVFLRSERNLRHQHTGFREAGVVVAGVSFPRDYDEARRRLSIDAMVRRIGKLPGVSDVAFSSTGQLSGQGIEFTIGTTARPLKDSSSAVATQLRVSPHFLGAMGTRLMAGRDFTLDDDEGHPPVGIVNQEFARRFLAPGDPIGQRFVEASASPPLHPIEVVGVVEDTKWHNLREQPPPIYYRPYRQVGASGAVQLSVRTTGSVDELAASLAREIRALDPHIVVKRLGAFTAVVDGVLGTERLVSQTALGLAGLALFIAALGLFGVFAHQVRRRRREIAVRLVLGARPRSIEVLVLGESMALLILGYSIGVLLSRMLIKLGTALLFNNGSGDAETIAMVLAVLTVSVLAAAYAPARLAAKTDPALALRD